MSFFVNLESDSAVETGIVIDETTDFVQLAESSIIEDMEYSNKILFGVGNFQLDKFVEGADLESFNESLVETVKNKIKTLIEKAKTFLKDLLTKVIAFFQKLTKDDKKFLEKYKNDAIANATYIDDNKELPFAKIMFSGEFTVDLPSLVKESIDKDLADSLVSAAELDKKEQDKIVDTVKKATKILNIAKLFGTLNVSTEEITGSFIKQNINIFVDIVERDEVGELKKIMEETLKSIDGFEKEVKAAGADTTPEQIAWVQRIVPVNIAYVKALFAQAVNIAKARKSHAKTILVFAARAKAPKAKTESVLGEDIGEYFAF